MMGNSSFVHKESHNDMPNLVNTFHDSFGAMEPFSSIDDKSKMQSKLKEILSSDGPIWK